MIDPELGVDLLALAKFTAGWESFVAHVYDDTTSPPRRVRRGDCDQSGNQYKVRATDGTATVGYGTTRADIVDRHWDVPASEPQAWAYKAEALPSYVKNGRAWIGAARWASLNPNQRASIGDLTYNVGQGNLNALARDLQAAIRAGDTGGQLREVWRRTVVSPPQFREGLTRRRQAEFELYSTPWTGDPVQPRVGRDVFLVGIPREDPIDNGYYLVLGDGRRLEIDDRDDLDALRRAGVPDIGLIKGAWATRMPRVPD